MAYKKLYLSADIEGTCGTLNWNETEYAKEGYDRARAEMTREVNAAVDGAAGHGWEVTVKDAHDSARNLLIDDMDVRARLIRGWTQDPYCMMAGIQYETYQAAAYVGYHSDAWSTGNPLSHTMTTSAQHVLLNGEPVSEFVLNAYAAALRGVPSVFLSGDAALCENAKRLIPELVTVPTKEGHGGAVLQKMPAVVCDEIRAGMTEALYPTRCLERCLPVLPDHFVLDIEYKEHIRAERCSWYPGAVKIAPKTVRFESDDYFEIIRAILFIL